LNIKTYLLEKITLNPDSADSVDLRHAVQMAILFTALKDFYLFV